MATRPIFTPWPRGPLLVATHQVDFQWFSGMAKSQAQKSIASLHEKAISQVKVPKVLEISSKSADALGVSLSAFNLTMKAEDGRIFSIECAFQASKVFENGGPFVDLLNGTSLDAKRDPRLQNSGRLTAFEFYGTKWDLLPRTAFYDWMYINALHKQPNLAEQVLEYRAFSDIAFNPEKSINCQAYAAALYVSLHERGLLNESILNSPSEYLKVVKTV